MARACPPPLLVLGPEGAGPGAACAALRKPGGRARVPLVAEAAPAGGAGASRGPGGAGAGMAAP